MASDGPAAWTLKSPRREDVLRRMVGAIDRWDLQTQRNINYRYLSESICPYNNVGKKCSIHNTPFHSFCRSFEPILYLTKVYHTPECQHWAVWALANLTKVYRKYWKNYIYYASPFLCLLLHLFLSFLGQVFGHGFPLAGVLRLEFLWDEDVSHKPNLNVEGQSMFLLLQSLRRILLRINWL